MAVRSMWMLLSNGCLRLSFRFGQALTRIHDLTFLSRSRVRSTFYDDLADFLKSRIDEDKIKADYLPEGLPNPEAYPVDYRIEGRYDRPLFLYGIPNRDKARLTTIILSHFHRNNLKLIPSWSLKTRRRFHGWISHGCQMWAGKWSLRSNPPSILSERFSVACLLDWVRPFEERGQGLTLIDDGEAPA